MNAVALTQVVLIVVAVAGWLAGTAVHRLFVRRSEDALRYAAELPRMSDTIAFISGAVGILLGLLLSFSVSNYQDAQGSVKEYGSSVTSAYHSATMFPEPGQSTVQKDLVCSVRTFVENDWGKEAAASATVSEQASLWMTKLNDDIKDMPMTSATQSQSFPILLQSSLDMGHWRELILLNSMQTIPVVIWIVIYVSVFLLAFLLTMHLADRRGLGFVSFGVAYVTLAVIIYALTVLDYPLHNFGWGPAVGSDMLMDMLRTSDVRFAQDVAIACPQLDPLVFTR